MIQEISISDLDPRQIKQLEGADRALSKDVNYSLKFILILKQFQMPRAQEAPQATTQIAKSNTKGISSSR